MPRGPGRRNIGSVGGAPVNRTYTIAGVLALCALSFVLRLRGIEFLLPHMTPPDSHHIVRQVELLRGPSEGRLADINYGKYPHLVARVIALLPEPGDTRPPPADLEGHLRRASEPFLRARSTVAWMSVLAVPATFLLARRFLAARWSLFAAFLVATSLLHVGFSQQARPHAPAMAWTTLAVWTAVRLRDRPTRGAYAAAGIAAALAVGCLHSGVFVVPPLLVAHALRRRGPGAAGGVWILLPVALVLLALAYFYPFLLPGSEGGGAAQLELRPGGMVQAGHVITFTWLESDGFARVLRTLGSYEPVASVLALLGLVAWAGSARPAGENAGAGSRRDLLVVLAHAAPYLLVLGVYSRTYERLVLPLVPHVACLAALGLREVLRALRARPSAPVLRRTLAVGVLAAALGVPALGAWRLASLRAAPDTITQVARWIRSNVEPGTPIGLSQALGLPLFSSEEALRADGARRGVGRLWAEYQLSLAPEQRTEAGHDLRWLPLRQRRDFERVERDPAAFVDGLEVRYLLLENRGGPTHVQAVATLYEVARERGRRVLHVAPDPVGRELGQALDYRDVPVGHVPNFTLRVLRASCAGPVVEVLEMPR